MARRADGAGSTAGRTNEKPTGRHRWVGVRALTDGGNYVGKLRLEGTRAASHEQLADDRAHLPLWDAVREGEPGAEFMAIHKGVIRAVVVLEGIAAVGAV